MKLNRILAIILCVITLLGAVACAVTPDDPEATSSDVTTVGQNENDAITYLPDDLPDNLNYQNAPFGILAWEDVEHEEFYFETDDGDAVTASIIARNGAVEDRLGLKLNFIRIAGNGDNVTSWNEYVKNTSGTSDNEYDVVAGYSLSVTLNASSNLLYDLTSTDCDYLDFEKPWWSRRLLDEGSINGKLYYCSGDISRNVLEMMYACFVNTQILTDNGLENPQTFVESGEWTFDKFFEMRDGIWSDDGDGVKQTGSSGGIINGEDVFAYATSGIHADVWFYGSGATICEKDTNGALIPSETMYGEKAIKAFEKLTNLLYNSNDGVYTKDVAHQRTFGEGRLLFTIDRARISHKVLAAEYGDAIKFSIVPCPKYVKGDPDIDPYVTLVGNPFTMYGIIHNCTDVERAAAFIECMASEAYRKVTPAVFEVSLKLKYVDDPVSASMYDIIKENITYDPGRLYSSSLIGQGAWRDAVKTNGSWQRSTQFNILKNKCTSFMNLPAFK